MELATIKMDRAEAREKFLEYRRSVRDRHTAEDEAIMRGYRALSQGKQIVNLSDTIAAGGLVLKTVKIATAATGWREEPIDRLYPALAVMRADQAECWVQESQRRFVFTPQPYYRGRRDRYTVGIDRFKKADDVKTSWRPAMRAMVPPVPPALRPAAHLRNFHVLWEAEWEQKRPPRPPGDPALLKRLGGDLFVVLAVWDLTPLEKAVLAGRFDQ